ncbi:MAG: hypothetical protein ACKPKO_02845, partial [Candidatus Fonsibacter sp.]
MKVIINIYLVKLVANNMKSNEALLARIRAMGDEASSSAESSIGIGDRLAGLGVLIGNTSGLALGGDL